MRKISFSMCYVFVIALFLALNLALNFYGLELPLSIFILILLPLSIFRSKPNLFDFVALVLYLLLYFTVCFIVGSLQYENYNFFRTTYSFFYIALPVFAFFIGRTFLSPNENLAQFLKYLSFFGSTFSLLVVLTLTSSFSAIASSNI